MSATWDTRNDGYAEAQRQTLGRLEDQLVVAKSYLTEAQEVVKQAQANLIRAQEDHRALVGAVQQQKLRMLREGIKEPEVAE